MIGARCEKGAPERKLLASDPSEIVRQSAARLLSRAPKGAAQNLAKDDARALSLFASERLIWVTNAELVLPRGKAAAAEEDDGETGGTGGSREECICRCDDRIPRPDAKRHQNGQQRVCAGRNADRVGNPTESRHRRFEFFNFGPQNEPLGAEHLFDLSSDWFSERAVLFAQIKQRHPHSSKAWQFQDLVQTRTSAVPATLTVEPE